MGLPDSSKVSIREFAGLFVAQDPHDLPPGGAVRQVNVQCLATGELRVRSGTRNVRFDQVSSSTV